MECLVCNGKTEKFIDFGMQPIANAFMTKDQMGNEYFFKMAVAYCPYCHMVQLTDQPDREKMFHENYAFFSSTSQYMQKHFQDFAQSIIEQQGLKDDSFVLEIGCNDGILLQNFHQAGIRHLGVEPSLNVAEAARAKGLNVVNEFFDKELALRTSREHGKANAIVSANVMCHIPYIHSVFEGVTTLLDEQGVFVYEDPYLGDIMSKTSFDQIYDEHVFYFSVHSVNYVASMHGMEVVDVKPQVTHGGSMRYLIAFKNQKEVSVTVKEVLGREEKQGLNHHETFLDYGRKVDVIKNDLVKTLSDLKVEGKKVVAYGATSKSTTVTNYFGITPEMIEFISDTTPTKHNKFSPGTHIPVRPYEEFHASNPDVVLLFAWNHAREIMEKEREYMLAGNRQWLVYIPEVKLVEP